MKIVDIKTKLKNIGVNIDEINMGDFDFIGEFTAKRHRTNTHPLYKTTGMFYRSNYERGILISNLIKKYNCKSMLEIGFGRGYSTFCAAKTFNDLGVDYRITTVDPNLGTQETVQHLNALKTIFPSQWFNIEFIPDISINALKNCDNYDLIYIDGDHTYNGTKTDWELTQHHFNKLMLFDDYHLPTKTLDKSDIECNVLIDQINEIEFNCSEKELIKMDRRMFIDDRSYSDEQVDYGQVLLTKFGL